MIECFSHVSLEKNGWTITGMLKPAEINHEKWLVLVRELTLAENASLTAKASLQAFAEEPGNAIMAGVVAAGQTALKAVFTSMSGTDLSNVRGPNGYASEFSQMISKKKSDLAPSEEILWKIQMNNIGRIERGGLMNRYVGLQTRDGQKFKLCFGGISQHYDFYEQLAEEVCAK